MTKVAIGVIGYGYWGPNLVRNFNDIGNAEMVAVADQSEDQLARVNRKYPSVKTVSDYRELFEIGVDAVAIATPPHTHAQIAEDCLTNGIGVLIEKPMALNVSDAQTLIQISEKHDQVLMAGHTCEYNPIVRKLKGIIDSGELGEIYSIDSVRLNLGLFQESTNVLWDLAPHDVSILHYLLGSAPISVAARGVESVREGLVDLAYMSLRYPSGVHCHVQVSWLSPRKVREITIVGSKKMLVFDDVNPLEKIRIYDKSVTAPKYTETLEQFHWSYRHGNVVIPPVRV